MKKLKGEEEFVAIFNRNELLDLGDAILGTMGVLEQLANEEKVDKVEIKYFGLEHGVCRIINILKSKGLRPLEILKEDKM